MAAEVMAQAGLRVTVCDAMPSVGRKFLMAGKSGLNLTKVEDAAAFHNAFAEAEPHLGPMLEVFGPDAIKGWAKGLGQQLFTGSTGRVFPKAMKASPLLRSWLGRLGDLGVTVRTRWRWVGWDGGSALFETPDGPQNVSHAVTVLALGGASWARLGSDGAWASILQTEGVACAPFAPANAGIAVDWSDHMTAHFGAPLKGVRLMAGPYHSQGEATISGKGLEGGGIYAVSRGVRDGHKLIFDLMPDQPVDQIARKLTAAPAKASLSNTLRKALKLSPTKRALLNEMAHPLPRAPQTLAGLLKALPVHHQGLRAMDEAISVAGGVRWDAVDADLMLRAKPGVFVAGEMLDWEAPTGGYLLTACFAIGAWAGHAAARFAITQAPSQL